MKHIKPDGEIELGSSGCCCPPGERRAGQHTNACTSWWRVNGGIWQRDHRISNTRILAAAANTVTEFIDAMIEQPNDRS
jgi:hypothetical protein